MCREPYQQEQERRKRPFRRHSCREEARTRLSSYGEDAPREAAAASTKAEAWLAAVGLFALTVFLLQRPFLAFVLVRDHLDWPTARP